MYIDLDIFHGLYSALIIAGFKGNPCLKRGPMCRWISNWQLYPESKINVYEIDSHNWFASCFDNIFVWRYKYIKIKFSIVRIQYVSGGRSIFSALIIRYRVWRPRALVHLGRSQYCELFMSFYPIGTKSFGHCLAVNRDVPVREIMSNTDHEA